MLRTVGRALGVAILLGICSATAMARTALTAQVVPTPSPNTAGTLRLQMDVLPDVDPALVEDEKNVELANLLYTGLVRLDASYNVEPAAAQRWTVSKDHTTYTFYLRKDLRFNNGDYVTAEDFAYAINRSLSPALKAAAAPFYLLDIKGAPAVLTGKAKSVSGVRVLNAHTLQISARWPVRYLLMELTYPTSFALDKLRLSKLSSITSTSWYSNPIGSGPYKLKSWQPDNQMVLVPNKYYSLSHPRLKKVVISLSQLPGTNLYQYVTKSLDVVALPSEDRKLLKDLPVVERNMLAGDGVYMKFNSKPFSSKAVRQALTLALNRRQLVMTTMGPSVTPSQSFVAPNQVGADPRLRTLPFDPRRAQALLKSSPFAGKKMPNLTLYYADDPLIAKLAKAIATSWHKYLQIHVSTQSLNYNTLSTRILSNSVSLYLFAWTADYPDPHDWLSLQWQSNALNNNVNYHNPEFDRVVATADVTWDPAKRTQLYNRAEQILTDDAAWIPLYIPHRALFIRPSVRQLVLTGYGLIPRSGNWADVQVIPSTASKRRAR